MIDEQKKYETELLTVTVDETGQWYLYFNQGLEHEPLPSKIRSMAACIEYLAREQKAMIEQSAVEHSKPLN